MTQTDMTVGEVREALRRKIELRWSECLIKNDAQNPKISGSHRKMKPM